VFSNLLIRMFHLLRDISQPVLEVKLSLI